MDLPAPLRGESPCWLGNYRHCLGFLLPPSFSFLGSYLGIPDKEPSIFNEVSLGVWMGWVFCRDWVSKVGLSAHAGCTLGIGPFSQVEVHCHMGSHHQLESVTFSQAELSVHHTGGSEVCAQRLHGANNHFFKSI